MHRVRRSVLITHFVFALGVWGFELRATTNETSPLTPLQAAASFQLVPGLRLELVACEPVTSDPCAIAWDEEGRLYVAENRGYPTGGPGGQAVGVVALLQDADGDGCYERRTDFVTGLSFPNGL